MQGSAFGEHEARSELTAFYPNSDSARAAGAVYEARRS